MLRSLLVKIGVLAEKEYEHIVKVLHSMHSELDDYVARKLQEAEDAANKVLYLEQVKAQAKADANKANNTLNKIKDLIS